MIKLIFMYLLLINATGLLLMIVDKSRARKRMRRISEINLFTVAIMGGSFGMIFAMIMARHKTRRQKFTIGLPVILALQVALFIYLLVA